MGQNIFGKLYPHSLLEKRPMIDFPIVNGSESFRKFFREFFRVENNRFGAAGPGQFIGPTMPWPGNFFQTPSLLTYVGLSEFDFRNPDSHLLGKNICL